MRDVAARVLLAIALLLAAPRAGAQTDAVPRDTIPVPPLFTRIEPLEITFTSDFRKLRSDRDTNAPWRHATMSYTDSAGARVVVPVRARTRGVWRLKNCEFPPLRLDFPGKEAKGTVFEHLGKPKLVNYCRDVDSWEQYILQELQLYRVYQLLTPVSYRVRLLRVAYVDSASGKTHATRYAFMAEDPGALARRMNGVELKSKGARPEDLDKETLALAYIFQFMIGNTDFSYSGLHNSALIGVNNGPIFPVSYDFDYAGAVNAVYAAPAPQFNLQRVRDRKFRGPCSLEREYYAALPHFRERKNAIYALYADEVGRRMDEGRVRETLRYFDAFYEMIATPSIARRAFLGRCTEQN